MNRHASLVRVVVYASALMLAALPRLHGQLPDQAVGVYLVEGEAVVEWFGHSGRTYFFQISDDSDPLRKWIWAPVIEAGNDESISYEFGGTAPLGFARLQYVNAVPPAGVTLEEWDADGDGLSNLAEITGATLPGVVGTIQTNPLSGDTDGDGLKDGWELAHGLDPTDNGSIDPDNGFFGDPDGDGSPNSDEQSSGTDPGSDQQHPPLILSIERVAVQAFTTPSGNQWIRYGGWAEGQDVQIEIESPLGPAALSQALGDRLPFPDEPPAEVTKVALHLIPSASGDHTYHLEENGTAITNSHAGHARHWLKVSPADAAKGPLEFRCLKVARGGVTPWNGAYAALPETVTVKEFEIDPATGLSAPIDLLPVVPTLSGNVTTAASLMLVPVGLTPDMNRDGRITAADEGRATEENPWRFWVNDDMDAGETGGDDIPVEIGYTSERDFLDPVVNGIRDLVDFFPVRLDLATVLAHFPETDYQFFLKQIDGDSEENGFNVVWYPEANPDGNPEQQNSAGAYLKNLPHARVLATRPSTTLPEEGLQIPYPMLEAAKQGKGVALIECRGPTTQSLAVEIRKINGPSLVEVSLPVKISRVADMFRWLYVLPGADDLEAGDIPDDPPNWPDADRNGKHFVFVHGYNVSEDASKGWGAEIFKRMFWSGSNARFSAFAWRGDQSQIYVPIKGILVTPNYQINLPHAFGTAKSFKQYLDLIEGEKTVAAHSMGNILVGSAMHDWGARPKNYFMIDSAAAKECYDSTEANDSTQDARMVHPAWKDYPKPLRASEWHNRTWTSGDQRTTLTWKNRLRGVIDNGGQTAVYNFYSSGEEVLNNPTVSDPDLNALNPFDNGMLPWARPNKAWGMQEKRKGLGLTGYIETSNYGGWFPNLDPFDAAIHVSTQGGGWRMRSPSELPQIPDTSYFQFLVSLTHRPFFDNNSHTILFDSNEGNGTPGSDHARDHRNTLIAEMIPCTTFATGSNAFLKEETSIPGNRNIDMDATMKTDPNEWPESNAHDSNDNKPRPWLHSDIREKAFTHNWKIYKKFVEIGQMQTH